MKPGYLILLAFTVPLIVCTFSALRSELNRAYEKGRKMGVAEGQLSMMQPPHWGYPITEVEGDTVTAWFDSSGQLTRDSDTIIAFLRHEEYGQFTHLRKSGDRWVKD